MAVLVNLQTHGGGKHFGTQVALKAGSRVQQPVSVQQAELGELLATFITGKIPILLSLVQFHVLLQVVMPVKHLPALLTRVNSFWVLASSVLSKVKDVFKRFTADITGGYDVLVRPAGHLVLLQMTGTVEQLAAVLAFVFRLYHFVHHHAMVAQTMGRLIRLAAQFTGEPFYHRKVRSIPVAHVYMFFQFGGGGIPFCALFTRMFFLFALLLGLMCPFMDL